jgi:hypothetical protein
MSWGNIDFSNFTMRASDLSDITEILPFVSWLFVKKKSEPLLILALYFACSGTIAIYGYFTSNVSIHNLHLYHIWAVVQIVFLYLFYKSLWAEQPNPWLILLIIGLYIFSSNYIQGIDKMNALCWTANNLFIIFLGVRHFYKLYHDDTITTPLSSRPDFIITAGWLVYAAGALFAYLMVKEILNLQATGILKNAWIFQSVSNIIKTAACCYGFYLFKKND